MYQINKKSSYFLMLFKLLSWTLIKKDCCQCDFYNLKKPDEFLKNQSSYHRA